MFYFQRGTESMANDSGDASTLCICGMGGIYTSEGLLVSASQSGPMIALDNMAALTCIKCGNKWLFDGTQKTDDGKPIAVVKYRLISADASRRIGEEKDRQWDEPMRLEQKRLDERLKRKEADLRERELKLKAKEAELAS